MSRPKHIPDKVGLERFFAVLVVLAMLLTTTLGTTPAAYAAPVSRPAAATTAVALTMVEVAAPDINCLFDADCKITVDDLASNFLPPAATGSAFLQSRLWPAGEAGTTGAGLYPYLYRIDLRNAVGLTAAACVTEMSIPFGPVATLDYNGDTKPEQIFVVTKGGLGNVKPLKAVQEADKITFTFDPAVCAGASQGKGDSSFFFGLASKLPPQTVPAHLIGTVGLDTTLRARAPQLPTYDIAYVLDSDTASAAAFQAFLGSQGYSVQLISINDVLTTNFSLYKLIIIGNDTGDLDKWGNAALQAEQIARGGRPVIGVGSGGYAYFGKLTMHIGWGNGWHGPQKAVIGDANLPYYQFPNNLTALLGAPLDLYNDAVDEVGIHLPEAVAGVTPLGREPNNQTHYPLIAEQFGKVCHQLWGFSGNPRLMNTNGQQLFANAVRYGLNNCPPAQQQPTVETPELPIFNHKEQIKVEILQADNTIFNAVFGLPKAQLWPVQGPDGKQYMEMAVPGLDIDTSNPGQPNIPVVRRILAVPQGAEVQITGIQRSLAKEMSEVLLLPAQPEPVDAAHQQTQPGDDKPAPDTFMDKPFTLDAKAYASAEPFPAQIATVQRLGRVRDLDLVQLTIATGQYIPAKRYLALFDKVKVEVKFAGGKGGFLPRERMNNPFDNHAQPLYELALNYQIIEKYPFPGDILSNLCWGYEYLIITDPAFRTAADNLRTWKIQKGISTKVVETGADAGDAGTTKEQIQQYIRNQFNNCIIRPSYVLLLGDAEQINPFYRNTNSGGNAGTDLDYALMDNADIMPDLAIGRIPVDTLDQANTVINKIINYEQHPPFAPAYYRSLSFASFFQCCRNDVADNGRDVRSFVETAELVRDELTGLGYTVDRIYTTNTGYEPDYVTAGRDTTPRKYRNGAALPAAIAPGSGFAWDGDSNDVINAFNDGRFLIFHRDHGWSGGWGDPGFTTSNIDSLTNSGKPAVVYSVNCASGFFDNETSGGSVNSTYWAEKLLRYSNGGAVGVIGDTRNSPTWANSALARGLFDATWTGVVPEGGATSIRRLGDILNYGKSYLAGQVGVAQTAGSVDQTSANDDIILYHVYGDPTMQMWTSNPWFIKLPRLYETLKFDPTIWEIRYPLDGAELTLLQDGVPVARGIVRNGQVALPLLTKFDTAKPYELSASDANGDSILLDAGKATGNVTPEQGGNLQDDQGLVKVEFPAGAVDQPATLLLSDIVVGQGPASDPHVRRFTLEAVNDNGETVDHFAADYAMHLPYTDEEVQNAGLDEATLRCQWLDETTDEWQPVTSSVDTANNILTCQADHFTEFAVTGDAAPVEMSHMLYLPVVTK